MSPALRAGVPAGHMTTRMVSRECGHSRYLATLELRLPIRKHEAVGDDDLRRASGS